MFTSTFDLTFDATFQGILSQVSLAADPCRLPGVYLAWLDKYGWAYYLFRGNRDEDDDVRTAGTFVQGGLERDTQRIERPIYTVRAGGLTYTDSKVLSGVLKSPAVLALAPGRGGRVWAVPVRVEPGTYSIWKEAEKRSKIEFKISFSETKYQRA